LGRNQKVHRKDGGNERPARSATIKDAKGRSNEGDSIHVNILVFRVAFLYGV
jgi:hypothetical protein